MINYAFLGEKKTIIINGKKYKIPYLNLKEWALLKSIEMLISDKENKGLEKYYFNQLWSLTGIKRLFVKKQDKLAIIKELQEINTFKTKYKEIGTSESIFKNDFNELVISTADSLASKYHISPVDVLNWSYIVVMSLIDVDRHSRYQKDYWDCKKSIDIMSDKSTSDLKLEKQKNINWCTNRMQEILQIINKTHSELVKTSDCNEDHLNKFLGGHDVTR